MIKEIHYKNFKALRDTTLPLGRFTLIVGANGTGKSTALQGLRFVERLNPSDFNRMVSADSKVSSVEIIINSDFLFTYQTLWVGEVSNNEVAKVNENMSAVGRAPSLEDDQKIRYLIKSFEIFSFDSEKMAESVYIKKDIKLESDGENLAGILLQMQNSEHEVFEELNNELRIWFPEFERIEFEIPEDGQVSFLLRTTIGKHKIKAKDLSDGTRLALAYLTLAYLPNPPKIVAFEEPEHGVHPRLLENIQEAMYRLAYPENYGEKREPVQVIATTHSPYLLDLYKEHPEEIVIASKDEKGVHFERLIDKPHYEEVIQDAPLGDIWYSGVLGGVPIQP